MAPRRVCWVLGASGSGKSAAVACLAARQREGLRCLHFDSIGIPSWEVMRRDFGNPENWQAEATRNWLRRIAEDRDPSPLTILEGQTRPSFAHDAAAVFSELDLDLMLLDCSAATRATRLRERGQPELANEQMQAWAGYLRDQAELLGMPVIDTTELTIEQVADAIEQAVTRDPVPGRTRARKDSGRVRACVQPGGSGARAPRRVAKRFGRHS